MLQPVILLFVLGTCSAVENPGIEITVNNKGLQYGKHAGADWIQGILGNITLPFMDGRIRVGCFSSLYYTFTDTRIRKCDLPEPSVEFSPEAAGLNMSISGLSVALTGEWMASFSFLQSVGSFNMALFSVDVTSVVKLDRDNNGHLSVSSVSCEAHVENVDISLSGGASWVFQALMNRHKSQFKQNIEDGICPQVEKSIANLEHYLQVMNVSFDVDHTLAVNLSLTASPDINPSSLNVGLKGEFFSIQTHNDPPFEAQPFTVPVQGDYMFSVVLSEYTVNSALYGYYSAGLFNIFINDSMIPPDFPVHLNTSSMGPYIPQLPKALLGLQMNLQVNATSVPMVTFQPDWAKQSFHATAEAFAVQPNGTQTPLFQLRADSAFSGQSWIDAGKVKGNVSVDNFTLTLISSDVGPVNTKTLAKSTREGIEMILTRVNEALSRGLDLPRLKRAKFVNSVLKVEQGFVSFFSDAEVWPTDRGFNRPKHTHEFF
ncbi:lipopolysaccharide-binding protein [Cynoglossus semilaevis]|uniref:Bactericidal permeability-increasing protein n=1 Tax=Cynoglossus semilaevis TaxID=244447 RepID=A0A3P8X1E8_CYNSE|nr:lipopolysaccharide-binding protein-like [Cynoglossus semilaevis]